MAPPLKAFKEDPTVCNKCDLTFATWELYHKHKIHSSNHITCEVCSRDFATPAAAKLHHDQFHPAEQKLTCPRCNSTFKRLGGLVSHIENTGCRAMEKKDLDAIRKGQYMYPPGGGVSVKPIHTVSGPINIAAYPVNPQPVTAPSFSARLSSSSSHPSTARTVTGPAEDDDFISFDEPSAILNSPWGFTPVVSQEPTICNREFPSLSKKPRPLNLLDDDPIPPPAPAPAPARITKAWGTKPKIVPDPRAAPVQQSRPMENVALKPKTSVSQVDVNPFDPDSPGFRSEIHYNRFAKEYICPHRRCNKRHQSEKAFLNHLRSPAHRDERLQCPVCLDLFKTATALTQHCESQGVRCKVRNTARYDATVEGITSGTALVAGLHADNTVKYAVNTDIFTQGMTPAQALTFNIKAEEAARAERRNNWEHNPRW